MEQPTQQVILVRHGETEWSRSRKHTGRTDLPLTPEGCVQAAQLNPRLATWKFERVLVSPMQRACVTCELAGFGSIAQVRDDLLEWNYGLYEGRLTTDIRRERPDWSLWRDGAPEGETAAMVGERVDRVIAEVRAVAGHVALFGHAHTLRVLAARWLGLPPTDGRLFMMEPAAISVLGYEREQAVIMGWNER